MLTEALEQVVLPGPQVNTPPPGPDEGIVPCGAGSPSQPWTPRRRDPTPKAKLSRSPKARRARERRDTANVGHKNPHVPAPLSELTKHLTDTPIKDMDAFVRRSREERVKEVTKKGKVSRPMNSFMLYRSAYAERVKKWLCQTNHQVVSRASGHGWKLETQAIRDKYEQLASIERDNHARAHPDYKFSPNKGPVATKKKEDAIATPPASMTDPGSPTDWNEIDRTSTPSFLMHHRSRSFDVEQLHRSRTSTPFDGPDPVLAPFYPISSWQMSYPGRMLPPTSDQTSVHPSVLHGMVEDVHFRRGSPLQQNAQYGSSSTLAALPGATHHELLQPQPTHPIPGRFVEGGGHMDPQLLTYQSDPAWPPVGSGPAYPQTPTYPVWNEEGANNNAVYLTSSAPTVPSNPAPYTPTQVTPTNQLGMQALTEGRDPAWEAPPSEIEPWFDHPSSY